MGRTTVQHRRGPRWGSRGVAVAAAVLLGVLLLAGAPAVGGARPTHARIAGPTTLGAIPAIGWTGVTAGTGVSPPCRTDASFAYDAADQYTVLFGGRGGCTTTTGPVLSDTWVFKHGNWTNVTPYTIVSPPPREGAALAFDASDGYLTLFGGASASGGAMNDTWRYSQGNWSQVLSLRAPTPRVGATMAYGSVDLQMVLFGGGSCRCSSPTLWNDTWTYAAGQWTRASGTGIAPASRQFGAFTDDPHDGYSSLFGGIGSGATPLNDTWTYVHGTWSRIAPVAAPSARWGAAAAYDPLSTRTLLFGGCSTASCSAPLAETWSFAGGRYANLTSLLPVSPTPRSEAAFAFDAPDGVALLLDGQNPTPIADLWAFGAMPVPRPVSVVAVANPLSGTAPLAVALHAYVTGGWPPYQVQWQFGDGSPNGTGEQPLHTFAHGGAFAVTVQVTDANRSSARTNVNISATAPASSNPRSDGLCAPGLGGCGPGGLPWVLLGSVVAEVVAGVWIALVAIRRLSARRGPVPRSAPFGALGPAGEPPASSTSAPPLPAVGTSVAEPEASFGPANGSGAGRLTDKIVLHIARQGVLNPNDLAPVALTQDGIKEAVDREQGVVAKVLQRMSTAGLVDRELRHVRGRSRRLQVYRLTPLGEQLARDLRRRAPTAGSGPTPSAPPASEAADRPD